MRHAWIERRAAGLTAAAGLVAILLAGAVAAPAAAQAPLADNPFAAPFAAPIPESRAAPREAGPTIRAQISPRHQTVLSAEIAGKIVSLALREGEAFAAGDRLVGLDCGAHVARRDRAAAQELAARRRLETAGRLDRLSSISRLELDEAAAALAAAQAETALADVFVARCDVVAPFSGRIAERFAEPHQYVAEGEKLVAILDDSALEVELIVPSRWLVWLAPGHRFSVAVDELDARIAARVARIGARVDPVSQSVKIFAEIEEGASGLVAGMSGAAEIAPPLAAGAPGG